MIFKETKGIYIQIADRICTEILQGHYGEEARIPSVREYAALVEVNVNTVLKAYEYLVMQDIIFNKRGLGYFVSPGAIQHIQHMKRQEFLSDYLPEFLRQVHLLEIDLEDIIQAYAEQYPAEPSVDR